MLAALRLFLIRFGPLCEAPSCPGATFLGSPCALPGQLVPCGAGPPWDVGPLGGHHRTLVPSSQDSVQPANPCFNNSGGPFTPGDPHSGANGVFAPSSALSICSWNTRALFSSYATSSKMASRRYKQMHGLVGRFDAVCLQETHGTVADAECLQRDDRCRNSIVHHSMIGPGAGGRCGYSYFE